MALVLFEKKIFLFFIISVLINCNQFQRELNPIFRCKADFIMPPPIQNQNILPIDINYKRNLDNTDVDGFKDFNIHLDLLNFEDEVKLYNLTDRRELYINGMNKAIKTIKSLLKVKPIERNYGFTDDQLTNIEIYNWNKTLIGNNCSKGMFELGIDLFIFVRFGNNQEMGEQTLAAAGVRYFSPSNYQPLIGIVNINRDVNFTKNNSLRQFESIILHEFTHILGFSNYYFSELNMTFNESQKYFINSTRVVNVAKKYFNCETIKGVQLEEYGGDGTSGSHWEERILLGDIMGGIVYEEEEVISEFTLALLEDLGFYKANYYTGGLMKYGKNKGCDFVYSKCVINQKVNQNFKNEFFDTIYNLKNKITNRDPGCSSGRQSRAYHQLYVYDEIPQQYQYFSSKTEGGRPSTDYCPVSEADQQKESKNIYYVGHCSERGSGEYGSNIPYKDKNGQTQYSTNGQLSSITGENNSDNSFCVLSSLISNKIQNYNIYSNVIRAVCYKMYCSNTTLTIQINNDFIVCPREGGKIKIDNYGGFLLCPDYYLICSGTVLCNDMFDCVEKKSLLKEDINYNYTIKTTQDIEYELNQSFSEGAYELSTNGICPQYCIQCNELSYCIKCKENYGIVESKENNTIKRNCQLESELTNGYFKKNGIYYKCGNNCQVCKNEYQCQTCETGYTNINYTCNNINNCINFDNNRKCIKCADGFRINEDGTFCLYPSDNCVNYTIETNKCDQCADDYILINNFCVKLVENCDQYEEGKYCKKCKEGFAFEEYNTSICKNKSLFEDFYYSKDEKISFFKCDGEVYTNIERIDKCKQCKYDNDTESLNCTKCENDYILKDDEYNHCYLNQSFINDKTFYYEDSFHVKTCSKNISNCNECEIKINNEDNSKLLLCNKCGNDFIIKDDENNICYPNQTFINNKTFYYEDSFHVKTCSLAIDNCLECEKKDNNATCIKCVDNYFIVNNNYRTCKTQDEIIPVDEYYLNNTNNEYYYCGNKNYHTVENCGKCINSTSCNLCKDGYTFIDENKKICKNISELGEEYIVDETDNTIYRKCNYYIDNCTKCSSKNICMECANRYGLILDKSKCIINNDYYYKNSSDNLYYPCASSMDNCEKCSAYNNCKKCLNGYIRINNNNTICHPNNSINYEEYYVAPKDNNMYIKCSLYFQNCYSCQYPNKCNLCNDGYIMLNNDVKNCKNKSKVNLGHYFTEDNMTYYSCDDYKYKNNIKCFSILPQQRITLTFIQAQIYNFQLIIFMLTHSPLPKNFTLIVTINVYMSGRFRYLQNTEKNISLTIDNDSNGSKNTIVSFISNEEFKNKDVQIKNMDFDNQNSVTNEVTHTSSCSLNFDKASEKADTGKVSKLIYSKKIANLVGIGSDNYIFNVNVKNIDGCEFNLNSDDFLPFSDITFNLELSEYDNNNNKLKTKCNVNGNNIKCKIEDKVDNYYSFPINIIINSDLLLMISTENGNKYQIKCENDKPMNKTTKIIIITCVIIFGVIITIVSIIICICKLVKKGYNKQEHLKNRNSKKESNYGEKFSPFYLEKSSSKLSSKKYNSDFQS